MPYTDVFGYLKHITIKGEGRATVLKAGAPNMVLIRWSDSLGKIEDLALQGNGMSGVTGLALIPSNTTSDTLVEHIDWNCVSRVDVADCAQGFELQNSYNGGCYDNRFEHCTLYNNTCHIRLLDRANTGGANRNVFIGVTMNGGNTGIWIDGADTTRMIGCSFEDILVGNSPSSLPTAVHTTNAGTVRGRDTADTNLIGCTWEHCTRDLNCNNRRISIVGGNCGAVGAIVGSATPDMLIGGDEQYHLRELHLGSQVDGLLMQPRQIAFTPHPQVATSSDQSQPYPFNGDGHLVLQSRDSLNHDVVFATGSPPRPRVRVTGTGQMIPATDGLANLGSGTARWNQVFAANGVISTSDARDKVTRDSFDQRELSVARRIAGLATLFQWKESIVDKGAADARLHCGLLAQSVRDAFVAEGLDPDRYAMNCSDEVTDDHGQRATRYSLRYSELAVFVMAAQEQRLAALEKAQSLA